MKRHILGRFVDDSRGSSFLRPLRRSRHRRAQMNFFSKARPVRRGRFLSWS